MSAVAAPATLDIKQTPGIPMSRLVRLELRKMFDTRAGMWLLISIAGVTALVMIIQVWVASAQHLTLSYHSFLTSMSIPMGVLLPVLGAMSVTSEWSQRTGLVTFTQVPLRTRTITAKLLAGVLVSIAAVAIALTLAVVGNLLYAGFSGNSADWNATAGMVLGFLALQTLGLGTGFAFGMLLINTAAAIVLYFVYSFVLPGLFEIGSHTMHWFHDARPWFDFNFAQNPLIDGSLSGTQWAHLIVSGLVWFVLPLTIGVWRLLRAEVK